MIDDLAWKRFDEAFQRFADSPTSTTVFRWEGHQHYAIDCDEPSLVAYRTGGARPERSVRTSPWLARIAASTLAGKEWHRVRGVVEPLSEYTRWEMLGYVESQAAGEQIRVARNLDGPEDFWVFNGRRPADRHAIVMHYDSSGSPIELEPISDAASVSSMLLLSSTMAMRAVGLNEYLSTIGASGAA